MQSFFIRGGLAAAAVIVIAASVTPDVRAQQAVAVSANPELAAQGAWDAATTYAIDDIVTARGSTWRSKRNNNLNRVPGQTQPSTATSWELFARGFNPAGAWSNATKYQPNDLVTHNGQTYRAKITNLNKQPTNTNNWELLAAKGANGAPGAQGPAGPNTGIAGGSASVPAISFTGDPNTGIFSPTAGKIAMVEDGALFLHNIGDHNTALGSSALAGNVDGHRNTAVGSLALSANTDGFNNTAFGAFALQSNGTGWGNTAVGEGALILNTDGPKNTAVGTSALAANTVGIENTAVGYAALALSTVDGNTAVGYQALTANTTGIANAVLGKNALAANTTGSGNSAVGFGALQNNIAAQFNTAVGTAALGQNNADNNSAFGFEALTFNTTGIGNTAVGSTALRVNNIGGMNTALGRRTLLLNTSGSGNIAIGHNAASTAANPSNSIFIGNPGLAADTATIKIGTQGTQTTAFMAGISGASAGGSGVQAYVDTTTGQLTGPPVSSARYKQDIHPMADVTAVLNQLRPVTFRYAAPSPDGSKPVHYGLIAEEVAAVMPYLAVFNADGTIRTVHYDRLPTFLLAGYQAQQKTIAAQAEEIAALKQRAAGHDALEARLQRIEALLPQTKAASLQ
jgi:hypothetical protein